MIACLTRSNKIGDIGFMSSPQRVNVLLSRARNALIVIGNPETFMNSRKGKEVWVPLMNQLKRDGHVYDGFPVKCEQHPDKTELLTKKEDFDLFCPDGGCSEPWYVQLPGLLTKTNKISGKLLKCDIHACPNKCHQLQDHSKMNCKAIISSTCPNNHKITRKCHEKASKHCRKCEAEVRAQEKKRQRNHELEKERQAKQQEYAARLAKIEEEIEHKKRTLREQTDEQDRQQTLRQKEQDLRNLQEKLKRPRQQAAPSTSPPSSSASSSSKTKTPDCDPATPKATKARADSATAGSNPPTSDQNKSQPDWNKSEARDDWKWQKKFQGAENKALDSLIPMIGALLFLCSVHMLTFIRVGICQTAVSRNQSKSRHCSAPKRFAKWRKVWCSFAW